MAQITLTLPDEMREQLKKIADEEERSLNGQVRLILSKAEEMGLQKGVNKDCPVDKVGKETKTNNLKKQEKNHE